MADTPRESGVPSVKSGTPSKDRENQDAATMSQSQPATSEEVQARAGRPATVAPPGSTAEPHHAPGSGGPTRQTGHPFDQSKQASDEDVAERAAQSPSRLADGDR